MSRLEHNKAKTKEVYGYWVPEKNMRETKKPMFLISLVFFSSCCFFSFCWFADQHTIVRLFLQFDSATRIAWCDFSHIQDLNSD